MSLTDLMMKALDQYMASRCESEDFKAKVQKALEDAEAQMARTRAILLGAMSEAEPAGEAGAGDSGTGEAGGDKPGTSSSSTNPPATGRSRGKDEPSD